MKKIFIIALLCAGINSFTKAESTFFSNMKAIFTCTGQNIDYLCSLIETTKNEAHCKAGLFFVERNGGLFKTVLDTSLTEKNDKEFIVSQFVQKQLPPSLAAIGLGFGVMYFSRDKFAKNVLAKFGIKIAGFGVISLALINLATTGTATAIRVKSIAVQSFFINYF